MFLALLGMWSLTQVSGDYNGFEDGRRAGILWCVAVLAMQNALRNDE